MLSFGKFKIYVPSVNNKTARRVLDLKPDVCFIRDDQGNDWYECQKVFSADTWKLCIDDAGIIQQMNKDASYLFPKNYSVVEVSAARVPAEANEGGGWVFNSKRVIKRELNDAELLAQAKEELNQRLSEAALIIEPLNDARKLDIATKLELKRLDAWRLYRVELSRVDLTKPEWPVKPDVA